MNIAQGRFVLDARSDERLLKQSAGGKAYHLASLERAGFPVPTWIGVSTDAFDEFVASMGGLPGAISTDAEFEQLERRFVEAALPASLESELLEAIEQLGLHGSWLAIRSSALGEDSASHSYAGQFSSFLFQKGWDSVSRSIKRCWASAWSVRASAYRKSQSIYEPVRMGVVVQKMIDAESSGVVFSRHPIRVADRSSLLISSVWGLGEGLVSGELDADHFELTRDCLDDPIRSHLVDKVRMLVLDPDRGGLRSLSVSADRVSLPSLTPGRARDVARLAIRAEAHFGAPQDIEFAFEQGTLYCLQSRPITQLPSDGHFDDRINGAIMTLWDNSNIIESYCGVTSPLTFSHISRSYREVYYQFCRIMGVPQHYIAQSEPVFRNMLGLVRGRVYYNLLNWYRLIFLFPGAATSKGFMETMMGVKKGLKAGAGSELDRLFDFLKDPPHYSMPRKVWLIFLSLYRYIFIRPYIVRFQDRLESVCAPLEAKGFRGLSFAQQVDVYKQLQEDLLKKWDAPIINDGRCMVAFGFLKALTQKWLGRGSENETLQNDLLCGEGDLKSTEPTKLLMRIAAKIDAGDPRVRDEFLQGSPAEVWQRIRAGWEPSIGVLFGDFLKKYGFRCVNELKLEEPDLHDDPSFVIDSVRSYVRMKTYSVERMEAREREIRTTAEQKVRDRVGGMKRGVYFFVLRWARRAVSDRENLRFDRTRTFGITRHLFRAMGGNLVRMGLLDHENDIFYLTIDELIEFQEGRSISVDFRGLCGLRKAEFDRYRNTPAPPDRFMTRGAAGSSFRYPSLLAEADLLIDVNAVKDPSKLHGTACSPGVVEGVVRVAHCLKDAEGLNGEILVTERTDPGWVPLYPSCSGLLIERGSLLSHSAVVARELGLPTIVGISGGLMRRLKTGQRIRMDAARGEVTIL